MSEKLDNLNDFFITLSIAKEGRWYRMASLVFPSEGVVNFFNSKVSNGCAYNFVDETY
jgi:hypothetical protein